VCNVERYTPIIADRFIPDGHTVSNSNDRDADTCGLSVL